MSALELGSSEWGLTVSQRAHQELAVLQCRLCEVDMLLANAQRVTRDGHTHEVANQEVACLGSSRQHNEDSMEMNAVMCRCEREAALHACMQLPSPHGEAHVP